MNANEDKQARTCAKEKPILFSAPMVHAILAGRKTQTRRIVKKWYFNTGNEGMNIAFSGLSSSEVSPGFWKLSSYGEGGAWNERCAAISPYGKPGDQLYVRETSYIWGRWNKNGLAKSGRQKWRFKVESHSVTFDPSHPQVARKTTPRETCMYWRRNSIHMPRWASRITLEITEVRVQRLSDVSEEDAVAEGVGLNWLGPPDKGPNGYGGEGWVRDCGYFHYTNSVDGDPAWTARESFFSLWDKINGKSSRSANPWVWALTFKVVRP